MIVLATLLFLSAAPAPVKDAFAFATPRETRFDDAVKKLGAPAVDYAAWLIEGDVDPFVDVPSSAKLKEIYASAGKRRVIEVRVAAWDSPRGRAKLVFEGNVLWYAVYPIDGDIPAGAETQTIQQQSGDVVQGWNVASWPEKGVSILAPAGGGPARRVIFPARAKPRP